MEERTDPGTSNTMLGIQTVTDVELDRSVATFAPPIIAVAIERIDSCRGNIAITSAYVLPDLSFWRDTKPI